MGCSGKGFGAVLRVPLATSATLVVHATPVLDVATHQAAQTLSRLDHCSDPRFGASRRRILPPVLPVGRALLHGVVVAREPRIPFAKSRELQDPVDYFMRPAGSVSSASTRGQTLDSDLRVGAISFPLLHSDPSDS